MKTLFTQMLLLACSTVSIGQTIRLHNLLANDPHSTNIYVGIDNKFLISPAGWVTGVQYFDGNAKLVNDTLFIKPAQTGPTTVTLYKPGGKEDIMLKALMVPPPAVKLEGHTAGSIRLGRFQRGQKFVLDQSADGFWDGYIVERFAVVVNNLTVVNEGAAPGADLADAIKKSPKGSMLTITMLELANTKNNRRETLKTTLRFVVE